MLIDQTIWTPISICIFYTAFKAMEGRTDQITQTIREKFWPTLLAGYAVCEFMHLLPTSDRVQGIMGLHCRVMSIRHTAHRLIFGTCRARGTCDQFPLHSE